MSTLFWNQHPLYIRFQEDWTLCTDAERGKRAVAEKTTQYLPATSQMYEDGYPNTNTKGWRDYQAYQIRAPFHNYMKKAVKTNMGRLWHKKGKISLPARMEDMRERATRHGEDLDQLWRNIHMEMLVTGRLGLLADFPEGKTGDEPIKYISLYPALRLINWDEGERYQVSKDSLNLVVLDETDYVRNAEFTWEKINQFRVLVLGDPVTNEDANTEKNLVYRNGLFKRDAGFDVSEMATPSYRGNTFKRIPFVFVNSRDTTPNPEEPPLLEQAHLDMTIYRTEADYRQTLFLQSQYTLVIIGEGGAGTMAPDDEGSVDKPIRTGAGAVLRIANPQGDAKYIGIDGVGLPEQREALQNDKRMGEVRAGQLTDTRSNEKESGDAMQKRLSGETCTLMDIALTGAAALQAILREIAEVMGCDPEEVIVEPNLEFADSPLTPKDLVDLQTFKNAGGPLSDQSLHDNVRKAGLTDKTYEEENEAIDEEEPRIDASGMLAGLPLDEETQTNVDLAVEGQEHTLDMDEHGKTMDKENLKVTKESAKAKAKADMVKAKQKPKPAGKK
jgi:hypothetical protein